MSAGTTNARPDRSELVSALGTLRGWWVVLALFSGLINLLMLTGSLFMLQVYDRVLPSRSGMTLIALLIITIGLIALQGALEVVRSRLLLRMGTRLDELLGARVYELVLLWPLRAQLAGDGLQPIRDLDGLRSFLSGRGPSAILDLPWMPIYVIFVFFLHPWLGFLTLGGVAVLFVLAGATEMLSRQPAKEAVKQANRRQGLSLAGRRNAEVLRAMGFADRFTARWMAASAGYRATQQRAGDVTGGLGGFARTLRTILQVATLALGAWLVIMGEATAGVIIASSIASARALAPIDQAIAQWKSFVTARGSRKRLEDFLKALPAEPVRMDLPPPERDFQVADLQARAPGSQKAFVTDVSFKLSAGQGLGIVGSSAAGKSTLVRALVGAWPIMRGSIRLDGASLDQYHPRALGKHIGYLPQDVELFDGTVVENIARFDEDADPNAVIAAARVAGVHDLILHLPNGYETRIGEEGAGLSGGQRQRIALARALYGDPFLVVLDEPNSNLDTDGEAALTGALHRVRQRGGIVIVVAHRQSALAAVDLVAFMEGGTLKDFGPKDEMLRKHIQAAGARPAALTLVSEPAT
ncbi:MAG: type I secretion system permease/ATPase [Rhizobiales bacterium]|nr:type I secretion system permease/ATPase [Hyphomicrobiales bacterium]